MATIKSFTDLKQSKKLAEILPIESADMCYSYYGNSKYNPTIAYKGQQWFLCQIRNSLHDDVPCWSLAALFDVLPERTIDICYVPNLQKENGKYSIAYGDDELLCIADNPVDACYEMILKLHELKLL